jgi:hypothetical protein
MKAIRRLFGQLAVLALAALPFDPSYALPPAVVTGSVDQQARTAAAAAQAAAAAAQTAAQSALSKINYVPVTERAPTANDACVAGNNWVYHGKAWTCAPGTVAGWQQVVPVGLPFDIAPGIGYGTMKMNSTYTGGMLSLEDPGNTQTPVNIGFLASGVGDYTSADAFAATYPHAYVKTWDDQGGIAANTYNALSGQEVTIATVSGTPTGTFAANATLVLTTSGCTGFSIPPQILSISGALGNTVINTGYCSSGDMSATQTMATCTPSGSCGSGATFTVTFANSGPTWEANRMVGNARALSFGSIGNPRGNETLNSYFLHFSAPNFYLAASTVFIVDQHANSIATEIAYETVGKGYVYTNYADSAGDIQSTISGSGTSGCGQSPAASSEVFMFGWNTTNSTCQNGNNSTTGSVTAVTVSTNGEIGTSKAQGNQLKDQQAAFLLFPTLTATQQQEIMLSLEVLYNIQPQVDRIVITEGDSGCAGTGPVYGATELGSAFPMLNSAVLAYNTCVFGQLTTGTLALQANEYKNLYQASARQVVDVFEIGYNNIRAGIALSVIEQDIQTLISNFKAKGSNTYAILAMYMEQCDISLNSTELAEEIQLNSWAQANLPQSQGGPGADAAPISFFADPFFGGQGGATPPFCGFPNLLTPDGEHPLDKTMALMAGRFAGGVNGLFK